MQSPPWRGSRSSICRTSGRPVLHQDSGAAGRSGDQGRDAGHRRRLAGFRAIRWRQVALFLGHQPRQGEHRPESETARRPRNLRGAAGHRRRPGRKFPARDDGKAGLRWETLHARYPKLIYGAASGFGDSGPYSKRAAYDMVVQGMSGIMSMTGQPDGPPTARGRLDLRFELGPVPGHRADRRHLQTQPGGRGRQGRRRHARFAGRLADRLP